MILLHSSSPCLSKAFSSNKPNNKTQKLIKINPLPKSHPTPLLITHNPLPQSKLQSLESVITKLESTIKNGITIDDPQIFASLLETCFQLQAIEQGIKIHTLIPNTLLRKNVGISSKLLRLYAKNGQLEKAHDLFDEMPDRNSNAFAWNSMISGYAGAGLYEDALALYFQMVEEGVEPDRYTFPRVLKACGGIGMICVGEEVHRHVIRAGFGENMFVLNAVVDMYAKCGDIVRARKVFDCIVDKELVSWNSMIIGYVMHGLIEEALLILRLMVKEGCEPDSVTFSSILTSKLPFVIGREIHGWAFRRGIEWDLSVANSLLVFYSKNNNSLEKVTHLFEYMPDRDVVSWNSVISAHSKDTLALDYFNHMMSSNVLPDRITFISLLSSCAHLGRVREAERLFTKMVEMYGITPSMEHYACMVNLYGRAGLVQRAYEFITSVIEFDAGPTVWGALLYSCYLCGNVEIGEIAANRLFELEPDGEHNFELLMNIYRKANRHEDVERIRVMMIERGFGL